MANNNDKSNTINEGEYEAELLEYAPLVSAREKQLDKDFVTVEKVPIKKSKLTESKGVVFVGRTIEDELWMKEGVPKPEKGKGGAEVMNKVAKKVMFLPPPEVKEDEIEEEDEEMLKVEGKGWRKYFETYKKD